VMWMTILRSGKVVVEKRKEMSTTLCYDVHPSARLEQLPQAPPIVY
jgi:hypothetical protein